MTMIDGKAGIILFRNHENTVEGICIPGFAECGLRWGRKIYHPAPNELNGTLYWDPICDERNLVRGFEITAINQGLGQYGISKARGWAFLCDDGPSFQRVRLLLGSYRDDGDMFKSLAALGHVLVGDSDDDSLLLLCGMGNFSAGPEIREVREDDLIESL